jgi:hypothetical protein
MSWHIIVEVSLWFCLDVVVNVTGTNRGPFVSVISTTLLHKSSNVQRVISSLDISVEISEKYSLETV